MMTLSLRLDNNLEAVASEVAGCYGFDLGSVTRALCSQMVRERSIPLNLRSGEPVNKSPRVITAVPPRRIPRPRPAAPRPRNRADGK